MNYFETKPHRETGVIVDTYAKLKALRKKLMRVEEFAFDTETNTLRVLGENKDFKLVGISISWGDYHNYYIPVGHSRVEDVDRQLPLEDVVKELKAPFERTDVRIIGANLKFDVHVMANVGINICTKDIFDVVIASWILDENTPNGLKDNTVKFLKIPQTHFAEVVNNVPKEVKKSFGLKATQKATIDLALIDEAAPYAIDDAYYTWKLYLGFMPYLEAEEMNKIYFKIYMPFVYTLYRMERQGVVIDMPLLEEMQKDIKVDIEELEYELTELAGVKINFGSSKQLALLLFGSSLTKIDKDELLAKDPDLIYKLIGKYNHLPKVERDEKISKDLKDMVDEQNKKYEEEKDFEAKYSFKFKVIEKTSKGAPATGSSVLWKLSKLDFKTKRKREGVEFVKTLMQYKALQKLDSAFIEGLTEQIYDDNKVHPSFKIIGTTSGRLSCASPNLQQLPKADDEDKYKIRSLFIGSEYVADSEGNFICDYNSNVLLKKGQEVKRKKIVALDFSNLEMRVLAHFSQDEKLTKMFISGADAHGDTAVNMFELDCTPDEAKKKYPHLRQAAKTLNFIDHEVA